METEKIRPDPEAVLALAIYDLIEKGDATLMNKIFEDLQAGKIKIEFK